MFGHLYSVFIVYVSEHYAVFKRSFTEKYGIYDKQGIEPAACLIHRLGDEVRGESFVEQIGVFERIVILSKRHRTGIEPTVYHFPGAGHFSAAARTLAGKPIEIGAMQFRFGVCGQPALLL